MCVVWHGTVLKMTVTFLCSVYIHLLFTHIILNTCFDFAALAQKGFIPVRKTQNTSFLVSDTSINEYVIYAALQSQRAATEEASVTFDLQNTNIDFCLAVFTSRIKKVFYTYVCKLCRSAFYVFKCFLFVFSSCLPLRPVLFYFVRIKMCVSHWIWELCLWGGLRKGGLSSPSS